MHNHLNRFLVSAFLLVAFFGAERAPAQTSYDVVGSGTSYFFSSVQGGNPTIQLNRGVTYVFNISAVGHPFFVKTNITDGSGGVYTNGVVNNGTQSGTLTFTVPMSAPDQLYYNCALHSSFGMWGELEIVTPVTPPPSGEIVLITLTETGITMKSIGSASWTAIPEYSSNLVSGAWAAVPVYTNLFANGTNTTTFNRLDPICGPNVFLRMRNQSQ